MESAKNSFSLFLPVCSFSFSSLLFFLARSYSCYLCSRSSYMGLLELLRRRRWRCKYGRVFTRLPFYSHGIMKERMNDDADNNTTSRKNEKNRLGEECTKSERARAREKIAHYRPCALFKPYWQSVFGFIVFFQNTLLIFLFLSLSHSILLSWSHERTSLSPTTLERKWMSRQIVVLENDPKQYSSILFSV